MHLAVDVMSLGQKLLCESFPTENRIIVKRLLQTLDVRV